MDLLSLCQSARPRPFLKYQSPVRELPKFLLNPATGELPTGQSGAGDNDAAPFTICLPPTSSLAFLKLAFQVEAGCMVILSEWSYVNL